MMYMDPSQMLRRSITYGAPAPKLKGDLATIFSKITKPASAPPTPKPAPVPATVAPKSEKSKKSKKKRKNPRAALIARLIKAGYTKAQAEKIIRVGVDKVLKPKAPVVPGVPKTNRPPRPTFVPPNPSATFPTRTPFQSQIATNLMQSQAQDATNAARVEQMREMARLAQEHKIISEAKIDELKREVETKAKAIELSKQLQLQETGRAEEALARAEQSNMNAGIQSIAADDERKEALRQSTLARLANEKAERNRIKAQRDSAIAARERKEAKRAKKEASELGHKTEMAYNKLKNYVDSVSSLGEKVSIELGDKTRMQIEMYKRMQNLSGGERKKIFGDDSDSKIEGYNRKVIASKLEQMGFPTTLPPLNELFTPVKVSPVAPPPEAMREPAKLKQAAYINETMRIMDELIARAPETYVNKDRMQEMRSTLTQYIKKLTKINDKLVKFEPRQNIADVMHQIRSQIDNANSIFTDMKIAEKLITEEAVSATYVETDEDEPYDPREGAPAEALFASTRDSASTEDNKSETTGSGAQVQAQITDVPLSNTQIDWLMRKHPQYLGTISRDEIPSLKISGRKPECFILNLDPSSQPGSHWVAVYMDLLGDAEINYYDSFGRKCPADIYEVLSAVIKNEKPPTLVKFKENLIKNQATDTNTCGWFCVMFLQERLSGKPFAGCSGYEDLREDEIDELKSSLKIPASFDLL